MKRKNLKFTMTRVIISNFYRGTKVPIIFVQATERANFFPQQILHTRKVFI